MRKVGYFFSGFLPIIVATAIQLLATFFLTGIAMISLLITKEAFSMDLLLDMLTDSYFSTGIMVIYSITCIVLFGLYYYHACGGEYLPKPSKTFDILQILGIVVLIPGSQFACSYLIGIVSMVFPEWLKQYQDLIDSAGLTSDITIAMLCYSVILAPIGEELIFRGVTMRLARRALPFWLANIFQALRFRASMHLHSVFFLVMYVKREEAFTTPSSCTSCLISGEPFSNSFSATLVQQYLPRCLCC